MKSPVRWAGSKRQMLSLLRSFWTPSATYIEPFAGSACLFFDLEPEHAVLGDLNEELISSYRVLRDSPDRLIDAISIWRPTRDTYYRVRALDIRGLTAVNRAARFFFLNRYCFNGLYRTNMSGIFNVPFGMPKADHQIDVVQLQSASDMLKRAHLMNTDFMVTIDRARTGDFVYLDPPYALTESRIFSEYLPNSFKTSDLERLREALVCLDRRGVNFAITYADCAEARNLMAGWNPKPWNARRHIAGFASHRRFSTELIATNRVFAA